MNESSSDSEIVREAINTLLAVVARSADDLRVFHAAVEKARSEAPAPFPRVAVAATESIIDHLEKVEEKLREVTIALGLNTRHPASGQ